MKEILLETKDKVKIAVNYYENGFDNVVIISPGWFMTKDSKSFKNIAEIFVKYSDVLVLDYRGHGKSSGFYTFTSREVLDILTVIQYAHKKYKKIYLAGFSLGAALSLIAASKRKYIDKIIVVSAPSDFKTIENHFWQKEAWLPTFQKFEPKRWLSVRPGLINLKKIKPIDIVDKIECPILFLAGAKDPTVCYWHTESLFNKATCKKRYELFLDCCHAEDLYTQAPEKFVNLCTEWLYNNN
ncbi:alpha/beta hydrolase [bacterium]|nr:alpha/beta hydrolase [bacterium]